MIRITKFVHLTLKDPAVSCLYNQVSRPSPGLQPATRRWRAFVCRSSGRPASPKHSSATAAIRSPFPFARRPRSRLGNPAWMCQSGGRHRFRQSSSPPVQARHSAATFPVSPPTAFIHARRTAANQSFLPHLPASTGPCIRPSLRSDVDLLCSLSALPLATDQAFTIAAPDHASVIRNSNKVQKKQPPHPKRRAAVAAEDRFNLCFPAERPAAGLVGRSSR